MARAAFLAKEEDTDMGPMDYRVLLMLSSVYRLYGKIRLPQLQPWIETWDLPEIYAGIEGKGASDAAYATAIEIEFCRMHGMNYSGGAADIYKCFDQVRREIVYKLLREAGLPTGILHAYRDFQETLKVRNTVAGGLGEPYWKPTSIPQGDPFSMMITSLLLRAWVIQMKGMEVKPRILADDLQLICTGGDHLGNFKKGFDATHKHLEDLGAKLAPTKSITWSSCTASRDWLRTHRWTRPRRAIKVITDGRDLGSHMNAAANQLYGTTLTTRMKKTT